MRSHTQEKLAACPTCGSMFSSNTKLFDHLHRQAEPVGKRDKLLVFGSQLCFFLLLFFNFLVCSTQSRLCVNTVEKLLPMRGF